MKLTDEQKAEIAREYAEFEKFQYAGKDKQARQKMGQFFTPPALTVKMLEKFTSVKGKRILDPTCGAGGLLIAALIAGADVDKVYGIELDPEIALICRRRISEYCRTRLGVEFPVKHIRGFANALDPESYGDFDNYEDKLEGYVPKCDTLAEAKSDETKKLGPDHVKQIDRKHTERDNAKKPAENKQKLEHTKFSVTFSSEYTDQIVTFTEYAANGTTVKSTQVKLVSGGKARKPQMKKTADAIITLHKAGRLIFPDSKFFSEFNMMLGLNDIEQVSLT